ncbi:autotransporter domain-containing protein [Pectobacterium atrosepticum]|nr:serine protease [Pectobacterium atrosepticum]KFX23155.1 serine protease [Pectobacterium atrosepticum]MBL0895788.1 autotransporter domain-containing protein [Pectobacterium atrosepticum]MCH5021315.1 autotransporter domain-containing protein [Pectobacterium atrosepticum]PWD63495.1 autotransporter domain-containing protein [Pectobacterium atrosepticum]
MLSVWKNNVLEKKEMRIAEKSRQAGVKYGRDSACYRVLTMWLLLGFPITLWAAEDFRTAEYERNGAALDSINAAEAYGLGFSGKGVGVAVIDANGELGGDEFTGRVDSGAGWISSPWDGAFHGYAVAGVIGAAKNDNGIHGIAYQANLLPLGTTFSSQTLVNAQLNVLDRPDIKIVNNSWGYRIFNDTVQTFSVDRQIELLDGIINNNMVIGAEMARQGQLTVFAAGNEGHLTPSIISGLPTLLDAYGIENTIANNWLNVVAYDPSQRPSSAAFIAPFSNLGLGSSAYTLLAPGVNIVSTTDANNTDTFSGTSFATPYVSGVAALAAEAFPYLNGKQLADILLSTATPLSGENTPRAVLLIRKNYDDRQNYLNSELDVYATGNAVTFNDEEMTAFLARVREDAFFDNLTDEQIRSAIRARANAQNINVLTTDDYQSLFGQGIVNAYKAVQGPGVLNAQRLSNSDLSSGIFNGNYAIYGVDTQGYSSTWSNDIAQVKNTTSGSSLYQLDVGLRKQGAGALYLTGSNTYLGPTIVEGGSIVVGKVAQGSGSLAGDVWVQSSATLGGHGKIAGTVTLENGSTLSPGASVGTLTVGNVVFHSGSIYHYEIDAQGNADGLNVTQDAALAGTVVLNASSQSLGDRFTLLNVGGTLSGNFDRLISNSTQPFLQDTLSYGNKQAYLDVVRNNRAFNDVAISRNQRDVAQTIESQRSGSVFSAIANSLSEDTARAAFDNLGGEIYAASRAALLQRSRYVRDEINSALHDENAQSLWLSTWANNGQFDETAESSRVNHSGYGFLIGNGSPIGKSSTLGVVVGAEKSKIKTDARAASTDVTTYHAGSYWGTTYSGIAWRSGLVYSYLDMDTERDIQVPGLISRAQADYHAHLVQGFAEGSHRFAFNDSLSVEPYGNLSYAWLDLAGGQEHGSAAALNWERQGSGAGYSTLGLRSEARWSSHSPVRLYADAGYQRRLTPDRTQTRLSFTQGGEAYTIRSATDDRDALLLRAGIMLAMKPNATLVLGYQGVVSDKMSENSAKMQFGLTF